MADESHDTDGHGAKPPVPKEEASPAPRRERSRTLLAGIRRSAKKRTDRGKGGLNTAAIVITCIMVAILSFRHLGSESPSPPVGGDIGPTFWTRAFGSPGDTPRADGSPPATLRSLGTGWQAIEIGAEPVQFNKNGIHPWDMDIPLGCIYIRLAKWAGGTEHGPYCGKGPKAKTPRGAEWVWSSNGKPFPAMYILYPN